MAASPPAMHVGFAWHHHGITMKESLLVDRPTNAKRLNQACAATLLMHQMTTANANKLNQQQQGVWCSEQQIKLTYVAHRYHSAVA